MEQAAVQKKIADSDRRPIPADPSRRVREEDRPRAVQLDNVSKSYGETAALDGVSLTVKQGEIFGLLGPNGAGKTTMMKLLTGLLEPGGGTVQVFGLDPWRSGSKVRVLSGWVMQQSTHDKYLSAVQNLRMYAELFGMPARQVAGEVQEVLRWAGLAEAAHRPVATYSGGMMRRLDLAAIKLQRPALVLLDEPTLGLDVQARRQVWQLVRDLSGAGATVIITTHYIQEAESLCHRIAMIRRGKIVGFDTPEALRKRVLGERHRLEVDFDGDPPFWPEEIELTPVSIGPSAWSFEGHPAELFQIAALLNRQLGRQLRGVRYLQPSLEDVFVRLTGSDSP